MTMFSASDRSSLDTAAELLQSVGRGSACDPATRVHCLAATDQLRVAGAVEMSTGELSSEPAGVAIRAAMRHLGSLAPATFAVPAVLAAADEAQTALQRYEDSRAEK